jgi:hypothetical protein
MIVQEIFTVTANTDVDDDIIFCRRLQFVGPGAQLVIKPKKGAPLGAQRMLKIVADVIDTSTLAGSTGEITYNLDGDYLPLIELPVTDTGIDPETQAKTGNDGSPNFNQGPLPIIDIASPNFDPLLDPLHWVGSFPKALAGGDGKAGGKGGKGVRGANAPILEIWTKEITGDLTLDLVGQKGGLGGKGGNAQLGGNGQMGSTAVPGTDSNWLGVPSLVCKQGPGMGGDGGRGGNAGCGGDGGDGGNGGIVKVFHTAAVNLAKLHPQVQKGLGGKTGPPGKEGKGGKSGPAGLNVAPCGTALSAQDGPGGDPCRQDTGKEGGISQDGLDGKDGEYQTFLVSNIPHVAALFP